MGSSSEAGSLPAAECPGQASVFFDWRTASLHVNKLVCFPSHRLKDPGAVSHFPRCEPSRRVWFSLLSVNT